MRHKARGKQLSGSAGPAPGGTGRASPAAPGPSPDPGPAPRPRCQEPPGGTSPGTGEPRRARGDLPGSPLPAGPRQALGTSRSPGSPGGSAGRDSSEGRAASAAAPARPLPRRPRACRRSPAFSILPDMSEPALGAQAPAAHGAGPGPAGLPLLPGVMRERLQRRPWSSARPPPAPRGRDGKGRPGSPAAHAQRPAPPPGHTGNRGAGPPPGRALNPPRSRDREWEWGWRHGERDGEMAGSRYRDGGVGIGIAGWNRDPGMRIRILGWASGSRDGIGIVGWA